MFEYSVLQVIWWMIMGSVLVIYAATAGFDVGVTMYMPFLRNEKDRRIVLNTSAPTWDGNLSWIVFAGGGLFVIWPLVYSTAFSGLYAAMLFILYSLFLRPPGYEYRNKIESHAWRRMWDMALFASGVLPVFIFGVAMGNCLLGFPFHFDPNTLREYYTGSFWQLFSPFALLAGAISVIMVLMHGSVYLQRRTEGHLRKLARKIHLITAILLLVSLSVAGTLLLLDIKGYTLVSAAVAPAKLLFDNVVSVKQGAWVAGDIVFPWKAFAPITAYLGVLISLWAAYYEWLSTAFWASCAAVGGIVATAGFTLFPFIMPSSTNPEESLTVWNSTSSQYALNIMFYVGSVLLVIILCYKIFAYHTIWSKKSTITKEDLEKNEHVFY